MRTVFLACMIAAFAVSSRAEEPSCVDRHWASAFDETCAPIGGKQAWLPLERWKKECAKTDDRDAIIRQACLDFYTKEIPRSWGEALTQEAWNEKCVSEYGMTTPGGIIQDQCRSLYVAHYASSYDLSKETWRKYCRQCVRPRDILAIFKDQCYSKYKQQGIGFAEWKYACDRGFEGKDPAQYVEDRKRARTKETRLTESRDVVDKAGKTIGVAGMKVGAAPSGEGLNSYFDGGGGRAEVVVGVEGASKNLDKNASSGPGSPQNSMGNLDRTGIPAPGELKDVRSQLVWQVDALERQKAYDTRVIKGLREVLEYTPENDAVALDDSRRTVEFFYQKRPKLVWVKDFDWPGTEGTYERRMNVVSLKKDLDDINISTLLIHEVGGHANAKNRNMFVGEKNAYDMGYRHLSNRSEILQGRLAVEKDPAKAKELKDQIQLLSQIPDLHAYRKDPNGAVSDLMAGYYGFGNEIQPGQVVISDQLKATQQASREAQKRLAEARGAFLGRWGIPTPASWIAEKDVEAAAEAALALGEDIKRAENMRERDRLWRLGKAQECARLLPAADQKRLAVIEPEIGNLFAISDESWTYKHNIKLVEIQGESRRIRASVPACEVR